MAGVYAEWCSGVKGSGVQQVLSGEGTCPLAQVPATIREVPPVYTKIPLQFTNTLDATDT